MKYFLLVLLSLGAFSAFSQLSIKISDLRLGKDTVYIGLTNTIFIQSPANVISVKSDKAIVRIKNDSLIVSPRIPGKFFVEIQYKDSVHTRSLVAAYLPDPGKEN
jgi:hypothetical protein